MITPRILGATIGVVYLAGFPPWLTAQQTPILAISYDFMPYRFLADPPTNFETVETRVSNPQFELNVPARLAPETTLLTGIRYSYLDIKPSRHGALPGRTSRQAPRSLLPNRRPDSAERCLANRDLRAARHRVGLRERLR